MTDKEKFFNTLKYSFVVSILYFILVYNTSVTPLFGEKIAITKSSITFVWMAFAYGIFLSNIKFNKALYFYFASITVPVFVYTFVNIVDVFNALQWIEPSESMNNTAKSANVIIGLYSTIREFYNNHGLVTGLLIYGLVYGFIAFSWVIVSSAGKSFGLKSFEFVKAQKKLLLPQETSDTLIAAVITSGVALIGVILTILTK